MESEAVEVLKEILDEVRRTNSAIGSLEGRLQGVEIRLKNAFAEVSEKIDTLAVLEARGLGSISGEVASVHHALRKQQG